jgi:hypothetical protein
VIQATLIGRRSRNNRRETLKRQAVANPSTTRASVATRRYEQQFHLNLQRAQTVDEIWPARSRGWIPHDIAGGDPAILSKNMGVAHCEAS